VIREAREKEILVRVEVIQPTVSETWEIAALESKRFSEEYSGREG
jgi:hypothetical protein